MIGLVGCVQEGGGEGGDVDPLDCNHITVLPGLTPQQDPTSANTPQDKSDKVSCITYYPHRCEERIKNISWEYSKDFSLDRFI